MKRLVSDSYLFPLMVCCGLATILSALFFERLGMFTYPLVIAICMAVSWLFKRTVYDKSGNGGEVDAVVWERGKYLCVGILGGLVILTGGCIIVAYWIMFIIESLN